MFRRIHIFLITFLIAFFVQSFIWQTADFTDGNVWINRAEQLRSDIFQFNFDSLHPVFYGSHPGIPAIFLAALLNIMSNTSMRMDLQISVALMNALAIAGIAYVGSFQQRNRYIYMIAGIAMVIFHPLYAMASPTNAVIAPLAVFIAIMALLLYTNTNAVNTPVFAVFIGIALGFAFTTRFETASIIAAFVAVLLARRIRLSTWGWIGAATISTALLFDPYLLFDPINHSMRITSRASLNFTNAILAHPLEFSELLLFAPIAAVSFTIAATLLLSAKQYRLPTPRSFLTFLIAMTVAMSLVFFSVRNPSVRYFMPIIFIWDFFAPLFIANYIHLLPIRTPPLVFVGSMVVLFQFALFYQSMY